MMCMYIMDECMCKYMVNVRYIHIVLLVVGVYIHNGHVVYMCKCVYVDICLVSVCM